MDPVYITKYALTKGIIKTTPQSVNKDDVVVTRFQGWTEYYFHKDYDEDKDDALIQAEAKRHSRIAALKKQIAKLEKLEIKIVEL